MFKFTSNGDFNLGIESVHLIKDPKDLVKRASSFLTPKYAKTKGQEDLHIIAVGAYEATGFNRNGDMFRDHWCRKNAHYFQDADRAVHRHHKNKKTSPKYGNIKYAGYNELMKRIELVVGLDKDKCADILDEQEKRGHTNWSMASKQAFDICTGCGHKAYSDADRCEHIPSCIGELTKEGAMYGMENPDPKWFEISYVFRPADRIGMSLNKLASGDKIRPMLPSDYLRIYTGFEPPDDDFLISKKASDKRSILGKAAEIEKHIEAIGVDHNKLQHLKNIASTEKIASETIDELRTMEPSRFFKLAADKGIILSPENFFSYLFGDRIKTAAVQGAKSYLKTVFRDLLKEGAARQLNNERFEPKPYVEVNSDTKMLFDKLARTHSIEAGAVHNRINAGYCIKVAEEVIKSEDAFDKELAKTYATYKLAALNYLKSNDRLTDDNLMIAVAQNYV